MGNWKRLFGRISLTTVAVNSPRIQSQSGCSEPKQTNPSITRARQGRLLGPRSMPIILPGAANTSGFSLWIAKIWCFDHFVIKTRVCLRSAVSVSGSAAQSYHFLSSRDKSAPKACGRKFGYNFTELSKVAKRIQSFHQNILIRNTSAFESCKQSTLFNFIYSELFVKARPHIPWGVALWCVFEKNISQLKRNFILL